MQREVSGASRLESAVGTGQGVIRLPALRLLTAWQHGTSVIHENRGLVPTFQNVTRRMALEGFLGLGPDFLTQSGGTTLDEDMGSDMIGQVDRPRASPRSNSFKTHANSNGKAGATGFAGADNALAVAAGSDLTASRLRRRFSTNVARPVARCYAICRCAVRQRRIALMCAPSGLEPKRPPAGGTVDRRGTVVLGLMQAEWPHLFKWRIFADGAITRRIITYPRST